MSLKTINLKSDRPIEKNRSLQAVTVDNISVDKPIYQYPLAGIGSTKDVLEVEIDKLNFKDDFIKSDRQKDGLEKEIEVAKDFLREMSLLGDGREKEEAAMRFLEKFLNQKYFRQVMYTGSAQNSVLLRRVTRQYRPNQERLNRKPLGAMSSTLFLSYLIDRFKACKNGKIKLSCYRHHKYWLVCTADFVSQRKLGISPRSLESAIRVLKDLELIETCPGIEYGRRQNRIWLNIETLTVKLIDSFVEYAAEKKRNYSEAIASQSEIKSRLQHLERSLSIETEENNNLQSDRLLKSLNREAVKQENELLAVSKSGFNLELGLLTAVRAKSSIYINKLFNIDNNKNNKIADELEIETKISSIDSKKQASSDSASSPAPLSKTPVARGELSFVNNGSYLRVKNAMPSFEINNHQNNVERFLPKYKPSELGYNPSDPELLGRAWNGFKGTYKSHARDEWMISNYKIDPEFFKWCEEYKLKTFGKPVDKPNLQAEIRNNFVRAGDLWCGYQSFKEERRLEAEKKESLTTGGGESLRADGQRFEYETWEQREEYMRRCDARVRSWYTDEESKTPKAPKTSTVTTTEFVPKSLDKASIKIAIEDLDTEVTKFSEDLRTYVEKGIMTIEQYQKAVADKIQKVERKKQQLIDRQTK